MIPEKPNLVYLCAYGFGNVIEDVLSIRTITELPELFAKHDRKL